MTILQQRSGGFGAEPCAKKVDPPGGTTGRVGCSTGWMRRPCWTQIHLQSDFRGGEIASWKMSRSVAAGTNAADVVAVGVELANPAAAAIAVVGVAVVAGGDR